MDASAHSVSSVLTQTSPDGVEVPVAFSSMKLREAQRGLYAALVALQKYRNWIFGSHVTVHSVLYITGSAPKSAKVVAFMTEFGHRIANFPNYVTLTSSMTHHRIVNLGPAALRPRLS